MSSLMERMLKNSTIKQTDVLADSTFFNNRSFAPTSVPVMNLALMGTLDGGLTSGVTVLAGPSRHFKTSFSLVMAKGFLDKHPDSVLLFYDSEFGSPRDYFASFGIDLNRVIHTPVTDIEQLKHDVMVQLNDLTVKDKVVIIVDSIGNIASKKEVDDAIEGNSVADLSRAKSVKSFFRMVTPHLTMKDIPMITIAHIYMTQDRYPKAIISGGQGILLAANTAWIIGRQQEKEGTETTGYNFIINVEKSRFVREKSKIPIAVTFEGGISKWSGLMDLALESGHVIKPSNGWYQRKGDDKKLRFADTNNKDFWIPILTDESFRHWVTDKFKLTREEKPVVDEIGDDLEDDVTTENDDE